MFSDPGGSVFWVEGSVVIFHHHPFSRSNYPFPYDPSRDNGRFATFNFLLRATARGCRSWNISLSIYIVYNIMIDEQSLSSIILIILIFMHVFSVRCHDFRFR